MSDPVYRIHDNKAYLLKDEGLYSEWLELEIESGPVHPQWKGAKIPFSIWEELKLWCEVTQDALKSEALALLFYDTTENQWHWWVPPQETAGMTVKALPEDPRYSEGRRTLPDLMLGSLHHHCTSAAFQSGTDRGDESDKPGLHFTIGSLAAKEYTIHARFCIDDHCYEIPVESVVDGPDWMSTIPEKFRGSILKDVLRAPSSKEALAAAQESMAEDLKKVSKKTYHSYQGNNGNAWGRQRALGAGIASQKNSIYDHSDDYWERQWEQAQLADYEEAKKNPNNTREEIEEEKSVIDASPFTSDFTEGYAVSSIAQLLNNELAEIFNVDALADIMVNDDTCEIAQEDFDLVKAHEKKLRIALIDIQEARGMTDEEIWELMATRVQYLSDWGLV